MLLLIRCPATVPPVIIKIQIHLMLLLIPRPRRTSSGVNGIQIHLMLLLILGALNLGDAFKGYSNTSHVTINPTDFASRL